MISLLLVAALAAPPQPLSAEAIRARYAGLTSLTADVVQLKEGKFWARPFESRVRLRYTPQRVVWETVKPLPSTVVIAGGDVEITDSRGARRSLDAGARDPRFTALLGFLQALLAFDLPGIEKDFDLAWGERELTATPRAGGAVRLFNRITMRFDADTELASLVLESEAERTRLTFTRVQRGAPGALPPR